MYNSQHRQYAARALVSFGYGILQGAYCIQNLTVLEEICRSLIEVPDIHRLQPFIMEKLVDDIRIQTFFENASKAVLIEKGYCIHNIDRNNVNLRALSKDQYKRPITLTELHAINPFTRSSTNEVENSGLLQSTIGFGNILKSKTYIQAVELDDRCIELLTAINNNRNELHFYQRINFNLFEDAPDNIKHLLESAKRILSRYQIIVNNGTRLE